MWLDSKGQIESSKVLGALDIDVAPFADLERSRKETKFLVPVKKGQGKPMEISAVVSCRQLKGADSTSKAPAAAEVDNLSDMSSWSESDADAESDCDAVLNAASAGALYPAFADQGRRLGREMFCLSRKTRAECHLFQIAG